jgi:hypothetical protein
MLAAQGFLIKGEIRHERSKRIRHEKFCDRLVETAAEGMEAAGAPLGMIVERIVTYGVAHMVALDGSEVTASNLHMMAERVCEKAALSGTWPFPVSRSVAG